jgi:hypothetical protein
MTDQKQPTFRELRQEAEQLGIITTNGATQGKSELATAITGVRLKLALINRGGGR